MQSVVPVEGRGGLLLRVRGVWRSRRRTKGSRIRTSDRSRQHKLVVLSCGRMRVFPPQVHGAIGADICDAEVSIYHLVGMLKMR